MNPDTINQLGLNSNLSGSDTILLEKVFNNFSNGKQTKMSPQERNYLMSKLTNQNSSQYISTKDVKDMTPEEKADHREALRKKLRDKQNGMKQLRTGGGKQMQQNARTSLQEMLSKIDMNKLNTHAEQIAQSSIDNSPPVTQVVQVDETKPLEESLDDFVDA